jgi:hypothetical protein
LKSVEAPAYLASSGYTLTVVLDFRTGRIVAFASNEKKLSVPGSPRLPAAGPIPNSSSTGS